MNLTTTVGEDMSGSLKYLTENLAATVVCAGINVESEGLFTGSAASRSWPAGHEANRENPPRDRMNTIKVDRYSQAATKAEESSWPR